MKLYRVHGNWQGGAETWNSDAAYDYETAQLVKEQKAQQYPQMEFTIVEAGTVRTSAAEWPAPAEVQP